MTSWDDNVWKVSDENPCPFPSLSYIPAKDFLLSKLCSDWFSSLFNMLHWSYQNQNILLLLQGFIWSGFCLFVS